jgi:GT2 family glycosyltransferase
MTLPLVKVGIPTLHRYDLLLRFIQALADDPSPCIEPQITVVDNGGQFLNSPQAAALAAMEGAPLVHVHVPDYNLGVAASWNWLLRELGRCVLCNDDIVLSTASLKALVDAGDAAPEAFLVQHSHPVSGMASMLVNRPQDWLATGGFDEGFWPGYFDDNDTRYRLKLMDGQIVTIDVPDWHHDNSSTLAAGDAMYHRNHWGSFLRNQRYYEQKWGGPPGGERFLLPFNAAPV